MLELTPAQLKRWMIAVFAIFACSGLAVSTWASRVPGIQIDLGINKAQIGFLLLASGIASIVGISLAPAIIVRTGAKRGILMCMLLGATGVAFIGIGSGLHSVALAALGLAMFGFGNGCVDLMMNVEAADIEQRYGRTMLPLFHAMFSVGTVVGAATGWLASSLGWSVFAHLIAVAIAIAVLTIVAVSAIPQRVAAASTTTEKLPARERLHAFAEPWREARTYGLGVVMLAMAFAEGGANDWIALGVSSDHGFGAASGAAALTIFSVAMLIVRVAGGPLVDKFGRVPILRISAVLAIVGLLMYIYMDTLPLIYLGSALWGAGVALGFPLGMSAAADDPIKAAGRVSAASAIGYIAFLAGPPLLGIVAESIGLLNALLFLVGLSVLAFFFAGAAKPLAGSRLESDAQAPKS